MIFDATLCVNIQYYNALHNIYVLLPFGTPIQVTSPFIDFVFRLIQLIKKIKNKNKKPPPASKFFQKKDDKLMFFLRGLTRAENTFVTSLYRKPTFSGLYSNFESFMPDSYKMGLIYTLLHRAFMICSDWNKFHIEVTFLKHIFRKNSFPIFFTDRCIKVFLDKNFYHEKSGFDSS